MYNVMTPIILDNGKTIWQKIGVAFDGDDTKSHVMVISMTALPLKMENELKLYIFPPREYRRKESEINSPPSDFDGDTPF